MENQLLEKLVNNLIEENKELRQEIKVLKDEIAILKATRITEPIIYPVPQNPITNPNITWDKKWWEDGPTCAILIEKEFV